MSVTLLSDERPVARKQHRCDVCSGFIGHGDRYRRQRYVDDDPYVFKCHALCDQAYWLAYKEAGCFDDAFVEWSEVEPFVRQFFEVLSVVQVTP